MLYYNVIRNSLQEIISKNDIMSKKVIDIISNVHNIYLHINNVYDEVYIYKTLTKFNTNPTKENVYISFNKLVRYLQKIKYLETFNINISMESMKNVYSKAKLNYFIYLKKTDPVSTINVIIYKNIMMLMERHILYN